MHEQNHQQGFSLIELLIVVAIIGIIAATAIPNLLASRRAANEAAAIGTIRTIGSAENTYRGTTGNGSFTDLAGLAAVNTIDNVLANATTVVTARSGYMYGVTLTGTNNDGYVSGAAPATEYSGQRNFTSDQPGVIYTDAATVSVVPTATSGTYVGN